MNNLIKNIKFSKILNLKDLISHIDDQIVSDIKNNANLGDKGSNEHCNNFATHCCLNCDKCWGKRYKQSK